MTPRLCAVATLLAALLPGCREGPDPVPADPLRDAFRRGGLTRTQAQGRRLFAARCATCHGLAGRGDGQNAYTLDPPPPDLQMTLPSHPPEYWRRIVVGGTAAVERSPLCPPWGRGLSEAEIGAVIAYLTRLAGSQKEAPPK